MEKMGGAAKAPPRGPQSMKKSRFIKKSQKSEKIFTILSYLFYLC